MSKNDDYRPSLFRPSRPHERLGWQQLLEAKPAPAVVDTLHAQLEGLIQARSPRKKLAPAERATRARELAGPNPEDFGVWAYFPWRHTLVHLLAEREFVELRTARNRYKITEEEQARLAERRYGVVGLSVGASIALTLATERLCGELRLADYDQLELSNLNRLRESVIHLGLPKVVLAARAIAELDPFLRVTCFDAGLTRENVDAFLFEGGRLDVLIEECDELEVKLLCRERARRAGIAVVMEANDRCTLDIERYDLEPERPILHGLLDGVDLSRIGELTSNEQKVPILLPMVGETTLSAKLAASFLEVGESLESWPQLASDVALGGAVVAHVVRRIALGELQSSGRHFVDLEALIADPPARERGPPAVAPAPPELGPRAVVATEPCADALMLPPARVRELVSAAVLAPSGGNQQPWRFEQRGRRLLLWLDRRQTGSLLDFDDSASLLGLGAAAENLVLEAQRLELGVELTAFPSPAEPDLIGQFRFFARGASRALESREYVGLAEHIGRRHTNRRLVERQPLPEDSRNQFDELVRAGSSLELTWVTAPDALDALGEVLARAERLRMLNARGHADFTLELKATSREAERDRDGIDPATLELTPSERAGIALFRNPAVAQRLRSWKRGRALERITRKSFAAASAVGILGMPRFRREDCFAAGRVVERLWLCAEARGLALQPHTAGLFLFLRLPGGADAFERDELTELQELAAEFQHLTRLEGRALFLFRLFPGCPPLARSLRRELDDVLVLRG